MIRRGPRLALMPYEESQASIMASWFYSGDYSFFFRDVSNLPTTDNFKNYAQMANGQALMIYAKENLVGMILIYDVRAVAGIAKLGILIDKAFQGQGYCTEALVLAGDYLFNHVGLYKLVLEFVEANEKIRERCERWGLIREAVLLGEAKLYDKRSNVMRYCITKDDAVPLIEKMKELLCQSR